MLSTSAFCIKMSHWEGLTLYPFFLSPLFFREGWAGGMIGRCRGLGGGKGLASDCAKMHFVKHDVAQLPSLPPPQL